MRLALSGADLAPLGQSLLQRATDDPSESGALLDASILFQFLGHPDMAMTLQGEALKVRRLYRFPTTQPTRLRLLALVAPGAIMANVPLECLLEDSDIELNLYYATIDDPNPEEIPEHDLLFVAIGESDANRPLLAAWLPRLIQWPRPVLNDPRRIETMARDAACQLLQGPPGLIMPPTLRLGRRRVQAIATSERADLELPLIIRPIDSHAGHDLAKVESPEELLAVLDAVPSDEFYLSPFIDYRNPDGLYRKYRVILVDGQPFACHMGVSSHWMIHYLNAGMDESPDKRAEEADFMATFDQSFAVRHGEALAAIHGAIGLEYFGIDCAETQDGRLLIFEVDPAMVVHAMDPVDLYPYKPPAMRRIFDAFRAMLIATAERHPPGLSRTSHRKA